MLWYQVFIKYFGRVDVSFTYFDPKLLKGNTNHSFPPKNHAFARLALISGICQDILYEE